MNSISKIWINAVFEIKIILRSWFFRIFTALSIILLFLINLIFFSTVTDVPRIFNGLSSFFPYANINLFNIAQSAILVFFATDIIRRDNKLNTNEVFYIRSMTNAEYLTGKALGLFVVFLTLNLSVFLMSAIYQLIFPDINFVLSPYIYYLFFMSVPCMIFIIGLSFFFMHWLKNQAVVIIVLLGYVAAVLFYLSDKFYHFLDFMPTNLPIIYSDFTGITHLDQILLQRLFYLVLGLLLFFLTVILFKRLPQSKLIKNISLISTIVLSIFGILFGYYYISNQSTIASYRVELMNIADQYKSTPSVRVLKCGLDITHQNDRISVIAKITFQNSNEQNIDKYFFSLNPGLQVEAISANNSDYQFVQKNQIVDVIPQKPLKSNAVDSITIKYSGIIDERYCYLDIVDKRFNEDFNIWMYIIDKKYAFISKDFVLLTPESNWYPIAGLPYGTNFPENNKKQFVEYKTNVHTNENLTVISQGKPEIKNESQYQFVPEHRLTGISLVIAPYEKRNISSDSIIYNLYTLPEHDYFEKYFTHISDTIASMIKESKQEYENKLSIEYPFPRLNIIEVPIQYFSYDRLWSVASERVQPEMVLLPENGCYLSGTDFKFYKAMTKRRRERGAVTVTDLENEAQMFKRFIDETFMGEGPQNRFREELMQSQQRHNIFPNYYNYFTHFYSDTLPLFNLALESYFNERTNVSARVSTWFDSDLTTGEKISRRLDGKSLKELLNDSLKTDLMPEILKTKGAQLIKIIQSNIESEELHNFFSNTIKKNEFSSVPLTQITNGLRDIYKLDLLPYINDWFNGTEIPGFLIKDIDLFKVLDGDRIRYQVIYKISNPENVVGITDVRFRYGERRGFDDQRNTLETVRVVKLEPGETKEIGIVLDEEPSIIYMNPMIAKNIPLAFADRFDVAELRENFKPFNGERQLDLNLNPTLENEYVVDNEDDSFQILSKSEQSFLKKLIYGEETRGEYNFKRYQFWNPAENWELLKSTGFYGKYIYSAYYIRAGNGDKRAQWEIDLAESGTYNVYTYVINKHSFGRKNFFDDHIKDFQYIVYHDDGQDEVSVDWLNSEMGWNLVGSYYFSKGKAKIEITDKTSGNLVVADAVKWVKD